MHNKVFEPRLTGKHELTCFVENILAMYASARSTWRKLSFRMRENVWSNRKRHLAGRRRVLAYLLDRLAMDAEQPGGFPLAAFVNHHGTSDLGVEFH